MQKYYEATESDRPRKNIKYCIECIKLKPTNAIDLGCGQGNDTWYLIKNGWNVVGIDREDVEERIRNRLSKKEQLLFHFSLQEFENLKLSKTNLVIANFSLSFCNHKKWKDTWKTIEEAIVKEGYFVGTFLGDRDSWARTRTEMTFFSKEEAEALFQNFKIIVFDEMETDKPTALGREKHWHFFSIIAQKN